MAEQAARKIIAAGKERPRLRRASIRRALAPALAVCIALTLLNTFTAADDRAGSLCQHHPVHTEDCGYVEAVKGHACKHVHTADCYTDELTCEYIVDEDEDPTASDSDAGHVHTQECYELDCPHDRGDHDILCGYAEAANGHACGYVCAQCGGRQLVQASSAGRRAMQSENGGNITIDEAHFPDEKLRKYLRTWFDKNRDGELSVQECSDVGAIEMFNGGLSSLKGIEYFPELKLIDCGNSLLTELDVSNNLKLEKLWCNGNQLQSLDVSALSQLNTLRCEKNPFITLKLSEGKMLTVGSATGGTVMLTFYDHGSKSVTLKATPDSGYTFEKWTKSDSPATDITDNPVTFTLDGEVTTTPVFAAVQTESPVPSGGGNSGSGGNSSKNPSASITRKPDGKTGLPANAETNVNAAVNQEGAATVTVPGSTVRSAIDKAVAEAKKNGTAKNGVAVRINVSTGSKDANSISVNLPKATQEQIISKQASAFTLAVDRPGISLSLSLDSIKAINAQADTDVQLTAARADSSTLSAEARQAIGDRPVFRLTATYENGAKQVTDFGGGSVTVEFPYALKPGELPGSVMAVFVDGSGNVHFLADSSYDAARGTLRFRTDHFSFYGVGWKAAPAFTDVSDHWAKDEIEFVAARGLLSGDGAFSPDGAMTRAMAVTALGRLSGVDISGYQAGIFHDVKADACYAPYAEWAARKNIVTDAGGDVFAPDRTVTRQEMAVIMQRYAEAMGRKLPAVRKAVNFADSAAIGSWAKDAVTDMQRAGVLMRKSGNRFYPAGPVTRAEAAAALHRYVELGIAPDTAF